MILVGLMFAFALALSGVAAFYSIAGLMAIFAAAPIPIAVMGSILEGSKLVVASWLYRTWDDTPRIMKGYFVSALVVLMFLTSMGIFGFLSRAHMEQGAPIGDVAAQVALLDEKIKTERETIDAARKALTQLDEQVNQTLARTTTASDDTGVQRSIAIRRQQAKERAALAKQIETSQAAIAKLNEQRAPKAAELRKVEVEVGPIKYIAALIYGEEAGSDTALLEKAVRWVTILIVSVFDPLAVMMLIAANWSYSRLRHQPKVEAPPEAPTPTPEAAPAPEPAAPPPPAPQPVDDFDISKHPYLFTPTEHFKALQPKVTQPEAPVDNPLPPIIDEPPAQPVPEQPAEPTAQSVEHPAFVPSEKFWLSRPR